jgi:NADH-quinone oxidoreductase subunit E
VEAQNLLNDIGLYHFRQMGRWTKDDQDWLEARLPRFKGKTAEWIEQAKTLVNTNTPGGASPNAAGKRTGYDTGEN